MATVDSQKEMQNASFDLSYFQELTELSIAIIKKYECLPVVVHYNPLELQMLHCLEECQQMAILNE